MPYINNIGYKTEGTSRDAAIHAAGRAEAIRRQVLEILRAYQLTADELADMLGETVLSVRPRVSDLKRDGLIEKTGDRRRNASGSAAWVWRIARGQMALL